MSFDIFCQSMQSCGLMSVILGIPQMTPVTPDASICTKTTTTAEQRAVLYCSSQKMVSENMQGKTEYFLDNPHFNPCF